MTSGCTNCTNITVTLKDTGSNALKPKSMYPVVPPGTILVTNPHTWDSFFWDNHGNFICEAPAWPPGCGFIPDTSNGGTIKVTFLVTGATLGENLTLIYTFSQDGLVATSSVTFTLS